MKVWLQLRNAQITRSLLDKGYRIVAVLDSTFSSLDKAYQSRNPYFANLVPRQRNELTIEIYATKRNGWIENIRQLLLHNLVEPPRLSTVDLGKCSVLSLCGLG